MRLLIDQNLSPQLVRLLADLFPGSQHVSVTGHDTAADERIWSYAREQGYIILSRDIDYQSLAFRFGLRRR